METNYARTIKLAARISSTLTTGSAWLPPNLPDEVPELHRRDVVDAMNAALKLNSVHALPVVLQPAAPTGCEFGWGDCQSFFRVDSDLYHFSITLNVTEKSTGSMVLHSLIAERTDLVPPEKRRLITAYQSEDDGFSVKVSPKNAYSAEEFSALVRVCDRLEGYALFTEAGRDLVDFLKFALRHH